MLNLISRSAGWCANVTGKYLIKAGVKGYNLRGFRVGTLNTKRTSNSSSSSSLLNFVDNRSLLSKYEIGTPVAFSELHGGFSRPKPLLITDSSGGKLKLTKIFGWSDDIGKVIDALVKNGLPVVPIIRSKDGKQINYFGRYPCILQPFIEGMIVSRYAALPEHFVTIGGFLAKAHSVLAEMPFDRPPIKAWAREVFAFSVENAFAFEAGKYPQDVEKFLGREETFILQQWKTLQANYSDDVYAKLPQHATFNDAGFANIVWDAQNRIRGVFDYELMAKMARIDDLRAAIMNAGAGQGFTYKFADVCKLVEGYKALLKPPLTKLEEEKIPEVFRQAFLYLFYRYVHKHKYYGDLSNPKVYKLFRQMISAFHEFAQDVEQEAFSSI